MFQDKFLSCYAADPLPARLDVLRERYGIHVTVHNAEAAEVGQIIVLSTKPQNLGEVMPGIRGHLRRQDLLLSILAGTPIRKLADGVAHASVVRPPHIPKCVATRPASPVRAAGQRRRCRYSWGPQCRAMANV